MSKRMPPYFYYLGWPKHFQVNAGFWNCHWWHTNNGGNACMEQYRQAYGPTFTIFNWYSSDQTLDIANERWVVTSGSCYDSAYVEKNAYWHLMEQDADLVNSYVNKKWIGMEYRLKIGTKDNYDGETEIWVYDEAGNVRYHHLRTEQNHLRVFENHKYNRIEFGGNRINSGYEFRNDDSWDNRYYIDDFIIDDQRIGPTYFALINERQAPLDADINNDSQVNVLDLQLCVNVVLGIEAREEVVNKAKQAVEPVDVCDVLDIQTIVNIILTK